MSIYETVGLNISIFEPAITAGSAYLPNSKFVGWFTNEIAEYMHVTGALGGFKEATIQLSSPQLKIEDWLGRGVGRHIEVRNFGGSLVWEGFVNRIEIMQGGLTVSRGPLMSIGNRVSVVYSRIIDATVDPPIIATKEQTTIAQNADSRARFGTIEKILTGGTCSKTDAEQYRDTYLAQMAWPEQSNNLAIGRADVPTIRLECMGYYAWLDAYTYVTATTGTTTLTAKLQAALAADIEPIFSTDYNYIDTNSYLTPAEEDDAPTAWTVIQAITAIGDVNDVRWLFGIYEDRKAHYNAIPTINNTAYRYAITDKLQHIESMGGRFIYPWDIRPGQWLFVGDFLIGKTQPSSDLYTDPRYLFIEDVRYNAPWELELNGQRVNTLNQIMAKQGLGGMG